MDLSVWPVLRCSYYLPCSANHPTILSAACLVQFLFLGGYLLSFYVHFLYLVLVVWPELSEEGMDWSEENVERHDDLVTDLSHDQLDPPKQAPQLPQVELEYPPHS